MTVSSDIFKLHKKNGKVTLSAFASDIGFNSNRDWIAIQSNKTGTVIRFRLNKEETDEEGDITHWVFVPFDASEAKRANGVVEVIIWND